MAREHGLDAVSANADAPPRSLHGSSHYGRTGRTRVSVKRFAIGFLAVCIATATAWPFLPRRFESTAAIILRPSDGDGRLDMSQALRSPLDENAIQSEMDIVGSPAIASVVIAKHHLSADHEFGVNPDGLTTKLLSAAYEALPFLANWFGSTNDLPESELRTRLKKHLTVSRDRRSYTVKLGYWSSDPVKAAAMTETLLAAYLEDQAARKFRSFEKLTAGLSQRVDTLRAKYENSERAIRELVSQSDLTDGLMRASLESQLAALGKEASEARSRFLEVTTRAGQRPKGSLIAGAAKAASWQQDGSIISQPEETDAEAQTWVLREALLGRAMQAIRTELAQRHEATSKLENLRREAAIDKEVFDAALLRLKELTSRASPGSLDVEILARPDVPVRPVFPDPLLTIIGTLLAACAAGSAMAWFPHRARHHTHPDHY